MNTLRGTMPHPKSKITPLPSRQFVTPSVFASRLTSRSHLVRQDDHEVDAVGLLDLETGDHLLVHRPEWVKYNEAPREAIGA